MKLKEIPDLQASKFPKRISVALSPETYNNLRRLRDSGKDTAEFLRMLIDRALAEVFDKQAS